MMTIEPLKDADISQVQVWFHPRLGVTLYCARHGAMNRLTKGGIWRCVSTYRLEGNRVMENDCKTGCVAQRS